MRRASLLDARTVSYLELIGNGRSYAVPAYQRDYSWTEEEWNDLWSDIVELRDAPEERHYMGALVVEARSDRDFLVIDGQQRLATLGLLALAVIGRLRDLVERGIEPEANRMRAQGLRDRFVGEKHPASLIEASRLTLNETDNAFYQDYLVQLRAPLNPRGLPRSNRLTYECFRYFRQRLERIEDLGDDGEALANLMFETVSRQLLFILITVEDDLNAYTVFETLNARGVELTTTDLLKNYLFSWVRVPTDLESLHRRWRALVGTVRQERFPDFLRYHLLSEHSKIRRPRLFRTVREQFRTLPEVSGLLERLEARAELFAAISDPNHDYWRDLVDARPFIRELALFRVRQVTPLLFTTWERFSPPDFVRVLKLVSVISFRYNLVSSLSRSELEPAYARAAKAVGDRTARSPAQVFSMLEAVYVDDRKMRQDFARLRVNTRGPRKRLVRYILARLEADASGREVNPDTEPATIEHILPENADAAWETEFPPERHEAFAYRIGNLTLLSAAANREIGRLPYARKLPAYEESRYRLTQRIVEIAPEQWTPALLEHRQEQLAARAVHIWRSDFD